MEHDFTPIIRTVLGEEFAEAAEDIFGKSPLLQYINLKTVSATRGSKSRSSFANLYAVYVLIEDYVEHGFADSKGYDSYEGTRFSALFKRQRELPFGSKLQNHALNHRMNQEFRKFFPQEDAIPILRVVETKRYWFNEKLLLVKVGRKTHNIARALLRIIDRYVEAKQDAFSGFMETCEKVRAIAGKEPEEVESFVFGLLAPTEDARVFEIVSYCILKFYYHDQTVYFGFELDQIEREKLRLYKTGRTNANDGGIDFVMKPLGRFFQVTETLDVRKYFLDIDKIERYPITFVIKSEDGVDDLLVRLRAGAKSQYGVAAIVEKYMSCIEEVINIPVLKERFQEAVAQGYLQNIIDEIVLQSKVEFNWEDGDDFDGSEEDDDTE